MDKEPRTSTRCPNSDQSREETEARKVPTIENGRKEFVPIEWTFSLPSPPPPAFVPMHAYVAGAAVGACQQPSAHMPPSLLQESILPYVALLLVILFYAASNPIGGPPRPILPSLKMLLVCRRSFSTPSLPLVSAPLRSRPKYNRAHLHAPRPSSA